jgi:oxygen-independent coproporphyrinogen-3 oxidase
MLRQAACDSATPVLRSADEPRAAYIHVPFCRHRCGYCNFTLVAGRDDLMDRYLEALATELSWLGRARQVDSLFFGGGTPTHLPAEKLDALLTLVFRWFAPAPGCEITVEANPIDITPARIAVLQRHGINRLSLGAQSFDAAKLRVLERDHSALTIRQAIELARPVVRSVSLDLIFAALGETSESWANDLHQALALPVDHVSTYGLTFEQGTRFWSRRRRGELVEIDDETWRTMFATAIERLTGAGFEHYEVSNFARPGHRCRHNEVYWSGDAYYAAGPGAARYVNGWRELNHRSTTTWIARVLAGRSPVAEREHLDAEDRAREHLVFALRRMRGVDVEQFARRTGFEIEALGGTALRRHLEMGTLRYVQGRLQLTRQGLFVSDAIWPDLLRR